VAHRAVRALALDNNAVTSTDGYFLPQSLALCRIVKHENARRVLIPAPLTLTPPGVGGRS